MIREELEKIVIDFLDSATTMTLSCSLDNEPWISPVFYARQGYDLVFFSSQNSRHSAIFRDNRRAAASVHAECSDWRDIRGLQMEGHVEPITKIPALARATVTYFKRYPFVKDFFKRGSSLYDELAPKMSKVALYIFRPGSILYMDNSAGLGVRWKLTISNGVAVGVPVRA